MDMEELADRTAISDVIVGYTRALDQRRWDDLDRLFTEDAYIDYTALGGLAGDLQVAKKFLAETMPMFSRTQHMLGLPEIDVDGDRATAATPCHNPMLLGSGEESKIMLCSLWYHHELLRTEAGWRIARLSEERNFMTILPRGDINPSGS